MTQNIISAELPVAEADEVLQHLAGIKTKLNFLLSLQASDITGMFKPGNAYLPFVDLAYQAVNDHPEILPPVFDKDEFMKDYALLKAMRPIVSQINELAESIQKTFTAVGSDSLAEARDVYDYVKQNKDKVPGLNVIANEMGKFFKKARNRKKEGTGE
jgi:hypothetical protein